MAIDLSKDIASMEVSVTMAKQQAERALNDLKGHLSLTAENPGYVLQQRLASVQIAVQKVGEWTDRLIALKAEQHRLSRGVKQS